MCWRSAGKAGQGGGLGGGMHVGQQAGRAHAGPGGGEAAAHRPAGPLEGAPGTRAAPGQGFHALEKELATPSSVLAWRIPGTRETGGLLSMVSHRVGHV